MKPLAWIAAASLGALALSCAGGRREENSMPKLSVTSSAFASEGAIPAKYTCDAAELSPPLAWSAGPAGTRSHALVMDDPDAPAGTWVHWVAWNLAGNALEEDACKRPGLAQGTNSWGRIGYGGPCPPAGTHRYVFKLYALDRELALAPSTTKDDLLDAIEGHVLAQGELMGKYARSKK